MEDSQAVFYAFTCPSPGGHTRLVSQPAPELMKALRFKGYSGLGVGSGCQAPTLGGCAAPGSERVRHLLWSTYSAEDMVCSVTSFAQKK
jgi:hypothetical protein